MGLAGSCKVRTTSPPAITGHQTLHLMSGVPDIAFFFLVIRNSGLPSLHS